MRVKHIFLFLLSPFDFFCAQELAHRRACILCVYIGYICSARCVRRRACRSTAALCGSLYTYSSSSLCAQRAMRLLHTIATGIFSARYSSLIKCTPRKPPSPSPSHSLHDDTRLSLPIYTNHSSSSLSASFTAFYHPCPHNHDALS